MKNPKEIQQIVDHCQNNEIHIRQNSGAVLGKLIDHDKHLLDPYLIQIAELLKQTTHDAVQRAIMRVFQYSDIPEEVEGDLFEFVINALKSLEVAIAIKAFGMTVARRICEKYPELANEMIPLLEIIIAEKPSTGLVNRAGKELKKLNQLIAN